MPLYPAVVAALSVEEANRGTTGALATTYDRSTAVPSVTFAMASGTLQLARILLPRGLNISNISFESGTTGGSAMSNQVFALFDSTRAVLAKTADDGATGWAATTKKTLAITGGPYTTTTTGWYYVGCWVVGTTPTLESAASLLATGVRNVALLPAGTSTVGLTTPASCTGVQTAITLQTSMPYAEVS